VLLRGLSEEGDDGSRKTSRVVGHEACWQHFGGQARMDRRRDDRRQSGGDGLQHLVRRRVNGPAFPSGSR
jgi:hypothetical protein